MVPVCTSDAQCASNPCDGTQRCEVASGRCISGEPPCGPDLMCRAVNSTAFACYGMRADDNRQLVSTNVVITKPEFTLMPIIKDWGVKGPVPRGFVFSGYLPAAAIPAGSQPDNLHLVIGDSARAILVDSSLAAPGKPAASGWIGKAGSGTWQWKKGARRSDIASVTVTGPSAKDGNVRVEVRGQVNIGPKGALADVGPDGVYAASLRIEWLGAKPFATRSDMLFSKCKETKSGKNTLTQCAGSAMPAK